MGNKTWDDQPDEVEHALKLGSFTFEPHDNKQESPRVQVEVRTHPTKGANGEPYGNQPLWWYVTAGDLFGSQTVKCKSADVLVQVLCTMGVVKKLPHGAELMENAK